VKTISICSGKKKLRSLGFDAFFGACLLGAVLLALSGCGPKVSKPVEPPPAAGISTILVVAFQDMATIYGQNTQVRSPISGNLFFTGPVQEDAPALLTAWVETTLEEKGFKVLSSATAEEAKAQALADGDARMDDLTLALNMGRATEADAVVVGHVFRFAERIGNPYSVESPASVAFGIHLVRVADGRVIWSARFDEAQKPLADNLLKIGDFLKHKGTWVTAVQLARSGLMQKLATFPAP
jgi:curli biogenesis system outer membrane secretion channel CsgG